MESVKHIASFQRVLSVELFFGVFEFLVSRGPFKKDRGLCILYMLFFTCIPLLGQKATIKESIEVAAGITQSLPQILITNTTDASVVVESISFSLENYPGLEWRTPRRRESTSTQTYRRLGEGWEVKGVRVGRLLKYSGMYLISDRMRLGEEREIDLDSDLKIDGSILLIKTEKITLAPDEGIIINRLPIQVSQEIGDGKIQINIQLNARGKTFSITKDLISYMPTSLFLDTQSDQINFIDNRKRTNSKLRQVIDHPLQLSCLSTKTLLQKDQRIGIRILGNSNLRWSNNNRPLFKDGAGEKIDVYGFGVDGNYLEVILPKTVKDKILKISRLEMTYTDTAMLVGSVAIQLEIHGTNLNIIPVQQTINFGAPRFGLFNKEIDLLPNQSHVPLPDLTIIEHPDGAAISEKMDIILKIVAEEVDNTGAYGQLETLIEASRKKRTKVPTSDLVTWVPNLQGLKYLGTASDRMGFLQGNEQKGALELRIPVTKDFKRGDSITVKGLAVKTGNPNNELEYSILASFDGGQSFAQPNGSKYVLNKKMGILYPTIDLVSSQTVKYLYRDDSKKFPDIEISNMGVRSLFKPGDVIIIKCENDLRTSWRDKNIDNPPYLKHSGSRNDKVSILSDSELRLELGGSLAPGKKITIGNMNIRNFYKRGRTRLIIVQSDRLMTPIAKTLASIEVTSPNIESMVEQLLLPNVKIQEFFGIQLSNYEDLKFGEKGIQIRLPENMGLKWANSNSRNVKLFSNGIALDRQVIQFDNYNLSIKPTRKVTGQIFIHDLTVESSDDGSAAQDTGRLAFSFNGGHSFSDRDSRLIRKSEPGNQYSEKIKKYQLISSNFDPTEELVLFLDIQNPKADFNGRIRNAPQFVLSETCSLKLSTQYLNPLPIPARQIKNNNFHISPDRSINQPKSFLEITGLEIEGGSENLESTRLGLSIHNYSGYDTLFFAGTLIGNGESNSLSTKKSDVLPNMSLDLLVKERQSLSTIIINRLRIRNPGLDVKSQSFIRALSPNNIKNVRTYISQHNFNNAQSEIKAIIRHSGNYWLGHWLNHNLYAEQQMIADAQMALARAEKYGWI
jgi:hypothetical protein